MEMGYYQWKSDVRTSKKEKRIGEITNTDWWFHQIADAAVIIELFSPEGFQPKMRWIRKSAAVGRRS